MSLPPPAAHSQSASSEFAEVGISCALSRPKYFLEIVLENGEAIAIDLSQTKWKYPLGGRFPSRGEARIEVDLYLEFFIFTSQWY